MSDIKLQDNWSIKPLEDICEIIAGQSPESQYYNKNGDGLPFFQGKTDFGALYPSLRIYCTQPQKTAQRNDILLSVRAPVGPTNLSPGTVCIGRGLTAIRPKSVTSFKYILYFFKSIEKRLMESGTGTTFKAITQDKIKKIEVPLPSMPEQTRIVAKIEELFSELDKGVEVLQKTKAQLKVYRQSVLKNAFEPFEEVSPIRTVSSIVTSGSRGWAKYYNPTGAIFIRIGNLTRDKISIDFSDLQRVLLPDKAEGIRTHLNAGDVLVSITADLGSIGLVPSDIGDAYINQHIAMVRFNNTLQSEFMAWFLRSERGQKNLLRNKRGAGKLGLGLDDIRDSCVPVVSDITANRVVQEIESRISVCDKIEQTVNESLLKAESLRQSILRKAFEGKLI